MSATTISFLTNDDALTVVRAYLMAMDATSFEDQAALVRAALKPYRPNDVARITGIPVARIYEYRREDLAQRHVAKNAKTNIMVKDFVTIMQLGNHSL